MLRLLILIQNKSNHSQLANKELLCLFIYHPLDRKSPFTATSKAVVGLFTLIFTGMFCGNHISWCCVCLVLINQLGINLLG